MLRTQSIRIRARVTLLAAVGLLLATPFASATTYQFRVSAPKLVAPPPPVFTPPRPYAQWDVANSGTTYAISGLTLTHLRTVDGGGNARASVNLSSGKWYWEISRDAAAGSQASGIASTSVNSTYELWGNVPWSQSYRLLYGVNHGFGTWVPTVKNVLLPNNGGDVLGFALDLDAGTFSVYENCSPTPYGIWSGVSGPVYPVVGTGGGALGSKTTANFGATPFQCVPPAGYNKGVW